MGRVFRVCSRFVHMKTQHVRVLAASALFFSLFLAGWCLLMLPEALAPTSMFEREWQIHVSHRQFAIQQLLRFPIAYELISWPPAMLVFVFVLVWVVCFFVFLSVLFVFVFLVFFVLHGDSSMDYVSIHFSSLLYHIVIMTNVATALIRWICTMQLSFRLDKRPGESHLALDGKKMLAHVAGSVSTDLNVWERMANPCGGDR